MFECDCCGLCCMNLSMSKLYSDLDRGDGICQYFNSESRLCTIYGKRPQKCNVDETYEVYFKGKMSREEYYKLNYDVCKTLKKEGENRCI